MTGKMKWNANKDWTNVIEIEGLLFLGFCPMRALHGKLVFPVFPIKWRQNFSAKGLHFLSSLVLPISIEVCYETNPNGNTKNVDNIFTPLSPSKSSKCDKVFVGWKIFHLCCSSLTVVFNKDNCHIFSNRSSCFDWPDLDWCQEGCLSWSGSREESFPNFDCRLWTWRPCLLATAIQRTYGRSERNYLARCSPQLRERKSDYF